MAAGLEGSGNEGDLEKTWTSEITRQQSCLVWFAASGTRHYSAACGLKALMLERHSRQSPALFVSIRCARPCVSEILSLHSSHIVDSKAIGRSPGP